MTIKYKQGNLLDVEEGIILHGCNAQGVMGSGVALAIKEKYPECYREYKEKVLINRYGLGEVICHYVNMDLMIVNAITQENYGRDGKRYVNYAAVVKTFLKVIDRVCYPGDTINFPKIGAGLGGGDWNIIEQLINDCDPEDEVNKVCWYL